jgi:short-subunit dehydrogenase
MRATVSQEPTTCFVTGASSGLGAAIAEYLATPQTTLILHGRDKSRLNRVADICRSAGANVELQIGDLSIRETCLQVACFLSSRDIDEAYLCAGVGNFIAEKQIVEDFRSTFAVASVNFASTVTLATAIAGQMAKRRRGILALVGSVTGSFPLPIAPTYSASKVAIRIFSEMLSDRLKGQGLHGVIVSHVTLVFVDTPMSRRLESWKPGLLSPAAAAQRLVTTCRRGCRSFSIPKWFGAVNLVGHLLPQLLRRTLLMRIRAHQGAGSQTGYFQP